MPTSRTIHMIVKKIRKSAKPVSAEAIARLADRGKDVSGFFKGKGRMIQPIKVATAGPKEVLRSPVRDDVG
jgi:hypothetical protein